MLRLTLHVFAAGILCLFVHECGHILAGWLTGGTIKQFVVFSLRPHVQFLEQCTAAQYAFRAAAGSGLLWLLYFCFLLLRLRQRVSYLTSSLITCFAFVELLGWVLSALFPGAGDNDAEAFLAASGISPYLVVTICLLIACAGAVSFRANRPSAPVPA